MRQLPDTYVVTEVACMDYRDNRTFVDKSEYDRLAAKIERLTKERDEARRTVKMAHEEGTRQIATIQARKELPACMSIVETEPIDHLVKQAFETTRYNEGVGSGKYLIREYIRLAGMDASYPPHAVGDDGIGGNVARLSRTLNHEHYDQPFLREPQGLDSGLRRDHGQRGALP